MKGVFHFFAFSSIGKGLSGGDRIYIEFARRWSENNFLNLYTWEDGLQMCRSQNLSGRFLKFNLIRVGKIRKLGFFITYLYRIFLGIKQGLTLKISDFDYVYSCSEFWMDSLPALIVKLRNSRVYWIAAWYQTAPNPWKGFTEGDRRNKYRFSAILYWLVQLPIKPFITKFADYILINNEGEKRNFPVHAKNKKAIVVLGAVDVEKIEEWKNKIKNKYKTYDAVFQGRFHPQKGVVELIGIWKKVVESAPLAKLAMIGDGPLMGEVKKKIIEYNLSKNIVLFGYVFDGFKKYTIFSQSKIVVHPAFYDSGGMAAAEAMAFGLPCVGFDLQAYHSYYPQGMVKVPVGSLEEFSEKIIYLIKDMQLREDIGKESLAMIKNNWSWNKRAKNVFDCIVNI